MAAKSLWFRVSKGLILFLCFLFQLIDDVDIQSYNLSSLRSQVGLVTQEPILFDCTIKDNILYGVVALEKKPTAQDIIDAAKAANIHDFIVSLPQVSNFENNHSFKIHLGDRWTIYVPWVCCK